MNKDEQLEEFKLAIKIRRATAADMPEVAAVFAFYGRHGFRVLQETDGKENEEKEPDVLLEWS